MQRLLAGHSQQLLIAISHRVIIAVAPMGARREGTRDPPNIFKLKNNNNNKKKKKKNIYIYILVRIKLNMLW